MNKRSIRKRMLDKRSCLPKEEKTILDQRINEELVSLISPTVRVVHTFIPMTEEINIHSFIQHCLDEQLTVVCPQSLKGGVMRNFILESMDFLQDGIFGTQYPASGIVYNGQFDLIIVPGLAYDFSNSRIGYGAGYYDRFLLEQSSSYTVGIAYYFQMLEAIPVEKHDIAVNHIIVGGC